MWNCSFLFTSYSPSSASIHFIIFFFLFLPLVRSAAAVRDGSATKKFTRSCSWSSCNKYLCYIFYLFFFSPSLTSPLWSHLVTSCPPIHSIRARDEATGQKPTSDATRMAYIEPVHIFMLAHTYIKAYIPIRACRSGCILYYTILSVSFAPRSGKIGRAQAKDRDWRARKAMPKPN